MGVLGINIKSKHKFRLLRQAININITSQMLRLNYKQKYSENLYSLPCKCEVYTLRGGVTVDDSHSWNVLSQRYAYDFIRLYNGCFYKGSFKRLENHYIFNINVYSPIDGVIIKVIKNMPDIIPQRRDIMYNSIDTRGNFVLIENSGEYCLIAHMKQHSIIVRKGQRVKKNEYLGKCGNSGYSNFPHLHMQVQTKKGFYLSKGIIIRFSNITIKKILFKTIIINKGMSVKNTKGVKSNDG